MERRLRPGQTARPRSVPSSLGGVADGQAGRQSEPVELARNGSMVQDEQDMLRLGNDMKKMKTNSELMEEGLVPDPIQQ